MPCGGIYPVKDPLYRTRCWVCDKPDSNHFIEEWDCGIHYDCFIEFAKSPEFEIIMKHGHSIVLTKEETTTK